MGKRRIAKELTSGIFESLVDTLLWTIFVTGTSFGKHGSRGVYRAFTEADDMLAEINLKSIIAAWNKANQKKLITRTIRSGIFNPEITAFGKKRLEEIIPKYHTKRPWDGKIYLITFDIPESHHRKRDLFRNFLRANRCKLLQESVWLTPYNPRELINEYIKEHKVPGTIIISDIGKDGGIGETTIQDITTKVYELESLNDRYTHFLNNALHSSKSKPILLRQFLGILKTDPQLPFPLLPKGWKGDESYRKYQSILSSYPNSFAAAKELG